MIRKYPLFRIRIVLLSVLFFMVSISVSVRVFGQTIAVKGVVSASSLPIRYATIIFMNTSDTTKKISALTDTSGYYWLALPTSVKLTAGQPSEFELSQNYPNPFATSTAISYQLNTQADVKITIYDILGRVIKKFTMGSQAAGAHGVVWDGRDIAGEIVSRGIYFCQLQAKGETRIKKMVYGFSGSSVVVTPGEIHPSDASGTSRKMNVALLGGNYMVRIENTDSTFPAIVAQQFDSTDVQNNATLNFSVSSILPTPNTNSMIVYVDSLQQTIRGFGGANILQWRPDMSTAEVQAAFGTGPNQVGLSILRLRVPYDPNYFSIQVETAKLVQSMGGIVFATPWTPPPWMKTTNNIVGGRVFDTSYASFAAYLKSFADYMSNHGAPLYAISIQNEPDWYPNYESCAWNAAQMITFLKNNAASIGVRMMAPESYNFRLAFSDSILNDPDAAANLSIVGGHIYGGGIGLNPLATSKGKEVWMTEYSDTNIASWPSVFNTGKQINDCMKSGWHAYIWWYIVRYYGPVNEDGSASLTKRGYVMSQYARFIRPGYIKVYTTNYNPRASVDITAYRNGSKFILVVLNENTTAKTYTFMKWNGTVGTFTPYETSSTKNCERQSDVSYKNGSFTYSLDPLSVTTFVSN